MDFYYIVNNQKELDEVLSRHEISKYSFVRVSIKFNEYSSGNSFAIRIENNMIMGFNHLYSDMYQKMGLLPKPVYDLQDYLEQL